MNAPEVTTTPSDDPLEQPPPPATAPKKAMFVVFLVVFIDLLGFGIVLPLLPRFADHYLHVLPEAARGEIGGDATLSLSTIGSLTTLVAEIAAHGSPRGNRGADPEKNTTPARFRRSEG